MINNFSDKLSEKMDANTHPVHENNISQHNFTIEALTYLSKINNVAIRPPAHSYVFNNIAYGINIQQGGTNTKNENL